jgi:hypothetical protein
LHHIGAILAEDSSALSGHDCCGATDSGNQNAALKMATMQGGVFGVISDSKTVLSQLP